MAIKAQGKGGGADSVLQGPHQMSSSSLRRPGCSSGFTLGSIRDPEKQGDPRWLDPAPAYLANDQYPCLPGPLPSPSMPSYEATDPFDELHVPVFSDRPS